MTMLRPLSLGLALAASPFLASCGDDPGARSVTIELAARVGERPFECGASYEGMGTSGSTFVARHLRFYVHGVRVTTADGVSHELALVDDGEWQDDGVALLDFENGEGCEGGNAPMNTRLVGELPGDAPEITAITFRVGVPADRNHLDAATAPSPLNLTSMYWGWQDGYKHVRIEGSTTAQASWLLHVGATDCSGDARMGTRVCNNPNVGAITLSGFDPDRDVIVADLAALFADLDLDVDGGGAPGCMSDPSDPECTPIFSALGISEGAAQSFFHVEERSE